MGRVFILDKSESMYDLVDDMIGGFGDELHILVG